jgi:trans-aconitate 2-methyltransferase
MKMCEKIWVIHKNHYCVDAIPLIPYLLHNKKGQPMWNPVQYNRYHDYRTRPAQDLIQAIPALGFSSAIDLGCGSGHITQMLADKFKPRTLVGLDSSESMLTKAQIDFPQRDWRLGDIGAIGAIGQHDLVFSNAALQWVPGHERLFPQLLGLTNKVLAIQMPNNFQAPSHVLLRETIAENPLYREKLQSIVRSDPVLSLEQYFTLLNPLVKHLDCWESTYLQQLEGANPVLEWVKGTALVPVQENLTAQEFAEFKQVYNAKLLKAYPADGKGITLFPFTRMFMVLVK